MPQDIHMSLSLIANIISDLFMLGLEAVRLWDLQMQKAKKVGIPAHCFSDCSSASWNVSASTMSSRQINLATRLGIMPESYSGQLSRLYQCNLCLHSHNGSFLEGPTLVENRSKSQGSWEIKSSAYSLKVTIFVGLPRSIRH